MLLFKRLSRLSEYLLCRSSSIEPISGARASLGASQIRKISVIIANRISSNPKTGVHRRSGGSSEANSLLHVVLNSSIDRQNRERAARGASESPGDAAARADREIHAAAGIAGRVAQPGRRSGEAAGGDDGFAGRDEAGIGASDGGLGDGEVEQRVLFGGHSDGEAAVVCAASAAR